MTTTRRTSGAPSSTPTTAATGSALKVANLRNLQDAQPGIRRVVTTNAETNAWMVAINDRLGFVPVAVAPTFKRRL